MTVVTHELKVNPPYFEAVERGDKNFEVRRDDRGFQKGDRLILRWHDPMRNPTLQGLNGLRTLERTIAYILTGGQFGLEPGYVVLGFEPCSPPADPSANDLLRTAVLALEKARATLHSHYVEWDGEPEDGENLRAARSECESALSIILPYLNVNQPE